VGNKYTIKTLTFKRLDGYDNYFLKLKFFKKICMEKFKNLIKLSEKFIKTNFYLNLLILLY